MNIQRLFVLSILIIGLFIIAGNTFAEFGQNKVQYELFSWRFYTTPHCKIYFHQGEGDLPSITTRWIENGYTELSTLFRFTHSKPVPLIIHGDPLSFEQTNVTSELIPEGVGGFTEMLKNRVVVPFAGSYQEYRHVIHHELVHAFEFGILFDQVGNRILGGGGDAQMPLWFAEGLAEYLSSGWNVESDMFLMDATIAGTVPLPSPQMGGYMVYKGGQSFLCFLAKTRGDSTFNIFLRTFSITKKVDEALEKTYGAPVKDLGEEWLQELRRLYWPEIGRREDPRKKAVPLTDHTKSDNYVNLKGRISPNGQKIAYFSDEKDYTSIFIVNRSGKILTTISQQGYGGYFESFHPFRTGIAWAPDSKRLAFISSQHGKEIIRIVDTKSKKLVQTIDPHVSSISSPDWSSDEKSMVFCGIKEGNSDLFICDIAAKTVRQLTNDIQFEAGPRFSPNCSTIVYSIEDTSGRAFNGKIPKLEPASDLFLFNLATNSSRRLTQTHCNEKQACFISNDSLLFVCDKNGMDNIYCASIANPDSALAITDVVGSCIDPDWCASQKTMVFTLFARQGWDIWIMENPRQKTIADPLAFTSWMTATTDTSQKFFNPVKPVKLGLLFEETEISAKAKLAHDSTHRPDSLHITAQVGDSIHTPAPSIKTVDSLASQHAGTHSIQDSLAPQSTGTSVSDTATTTIKPLAWDNTSYPYRLQFSPDFFTVGLGINSLYGTSGQWVLVLSDLLGDHQITLMGDVQAQLDQMIHIYGSYLSMKHRLNFGIGGLFSKDYTNASVFADSLFHDTNIGLFALLRYPFTRFARLDLRLYYRNAYREPIFVSSGNLSSDTSRSPVTMNIFIPSLSYTFDNILWGITGPISGIRGAATLQASPPINKLDAEFVSADIDVRHYWHIAHKLVWANRLMLGGTWSANSNKPTRRFLLGGNENWFNYDANPEVYQKNSANIFYSDIVTPFRGWEYFSLAGSRCAVLNTEFRFPFIRDITLDWPAPISIRWINGAVFSDFGNAWDAADETGSLPLPPKIYGGIGFGFRANLGIFVLRYDRAWQTDWTTYARHPISYYSLGAEY